MTDDDRHPELDVRAKRSNLLLLAVVELLAMSMWFSASAVVPQLTLEWDLAAAGQAWLTMSVQIGFVCGALGMAVFNLADRIPASRLIAVSALAGACFNACIPIFATGAGPAIVFRFLTGAALAGVYPPGMKIMASWCRQDRGLCIGILVGALTVGSGMPHLLAALSSGGGAGIPPWRIVVYGSSGQAILAALVASVWVQAGPYLGTARGFDWRHATAGLRDRATRLANFGYFGHMWELYAVWAWAPLLLLASYRAAGWSDQAARYAAFAIFIAGGVSCILAGRWSDRVGRTLVTSASLLISGVCCLGAGFLFGSPLALTGLCLVWGLAVVSDSAQFSAAVSELADPRYVGTALQVQTSIGFLLTLVTLRLIPALVERAGWESAFVVLAIGPVFGIVSMLRLRLMPDAKRMAGGRR